MNYNTKIKVGILSPFSWCCNLFQYPLFSDRDVKVCAAAINVYSGLVCYPTV